MIFSYNLDPGGAWILYHRGDSRPESCGHSSYAQSTKYSVIPLASTRGEERESTEILAEWGPRTRRDRQVQGGSREVQKSWVFCSQRWLAEEVENLKRSETPIYHRY